jgi:SAM-dependent methyltransferase
MTQFTTVADHNLATQELLAEAKNYNRWIFELTAPFLGKRILDIGCSIGNITQHFLDRDCIVGVDCDGKAIEEIQRRFSRYSNFHGFHSDFSNLDLDNLQTFAFDTITCLNVLEHIDDDHNALVTMHTLLVDSGRLVLIVPALQWLYGSMDAADGHFRRYSTRELKEKLSTAGFTVSKLQYRNLPGIFGWFLNGRIRKVPFIPKKQLALYDKIIPLIQRLEKRVSFPVGQSILAVAEKRSASVLS